MNAQQSDKLAIVAASLVLIALLLMAAAGLSAQVVGGKFLLGGQNSAASSSAQGGEWTSFTRDYNDSRYNPDSTINSSNVGQMTQRWFLQTNYSITSTPVVQDGKVYFADWGGNVYSADLANGTIVWKVNLGGLPISSSLALADGRVFVGFPPLRLSIYGGHPKVYALDQYTGKTLWSDLINTTSSSIWASPTVYNGLVYIGVSGNGTGDKTQYGGVVALNETTGSLVWSFQTGVQAPGAPVWGSVVVDPKLNAIYFGTGNPYNVPSNSSTSILYSYCIMSLDATSGKLRWYYRAHYSHLAADDQDFGSTPNLFTLRVNSTIREAVGLGGKDGVYYILDRTNGAVILNYNATPDGITGVPGFVYQNGDPGNPEVFIPITGNLGGVAALSPVAHTISWNITGHRVAGSVAIIPGAVLYGDGNGNFFALSTSDGSVLFSKTVSFGIAAGITAAEGTVLFGNYYRNLTANSQLGLFALSLPGTT